MVNGCFLCIKVKESCNHIFLWCPLAYKLWIIVCGLLGISWVIASTVMDKIRAYKGISGGKNMWASFPLLYFVWCKERNRRAFKRVEDDLNGVRSKWFQTLSFFVMGHYLYYMKDVRDLSDILITYK